MITFMQIFLLRNKRSNVSFCIRLSCPRKVDKDSQKMIKQKRFAMSLCISFDLIFTCLLFFLSEHSFHSLPRAILSSFWYLFCSYFFFLLFDSLFFFYYVSINKKQTLKDNIFCVEKYTCTVRSVEFKTIKRNISRISFKNILYNALRLLLCWKYSQPFFSLISYHRRSPSSKRKHQSGKVKGGKQWKKSGHL